MIQEPRLSEGPDTSVYLRNSPLEGGAFLQWSYFSRIVVEDRIVHPVNQKDFFLACNRSSLLGFVDYLGLANLHFVCADGSQDLDVLGLKLCSHCNGRSHFTTR